LVLDKDFYFDALKKFVPNSIPPECSNSSDDEGERDLLKNDDGMLFARDIW